ncbi:coiled-coil domain-containing protein 180-like, partial [Brachyistius frenatus]|uniref:coiled-coil domain-containing protein 180-like n=1 Tax=Brachyistius frenatus TaxID=100188 RepID=UPI0037E9A084
MLNQSLLANRRCSARLLLLLQEENLQQESLLRRVWEDRLSLWRSSRVHQVLDQFRSVCSGEDEDDEQQQLQTETLTERRCDIIMNICSLIPPTCSATLVSDWFEQLTAVNQQIECFHADLLHQLQCRSELRWQRLLEEAELQKEALTALQLSEEEVDDIVRSQMLTLIGQRQTHDEQRLAALDVCNDSAAHHALGLSRCVFVVMRAAVLLWETHCRRLERTEEEVQRHLDELRHSQHEHVQGKQVRLDNLLGRLRQESSEDALKTSLDETVLYLQDVQHSCRQCVSDQWEVLDRLPSLLVDDLLSYRSSLSSFFRLSPTYQPSPEELQYLHLPSPPSQDPGRRLEPSLTSVSVCVEAIGAAETQEAERQQPIRCQEDAEPAHHWLTEAESALLEIYDISSFVTITSLKGVVYTGPVFRCPAPDLQQETHLSLFPVDLLTHTLSRTRTLFVEHLEQRFHDVLTSGVAMVTDRKEAVCRQQEVHLQQLNPQHIERHIYLPRLAELQLHQKLLLLHCDEVSGAVTSCGTELQELQASLSRRNQEFRATLSNMEDDVQTADSSQRVEAVTSALQDCVDQHIKDTQRCESVFRQTLRTQLMEARRRTEQLLTSARLFSEGGDFSPQEVMAVQRRLKEDIKRISAAEESICSELQALQSRSLQQVKEASTRLEEKLCSLKVQLRFMEEVQRETSRTRVHIKAQAAISNQHQFQISSRLEDLKMMKNTQVSPDHLCPLLSSVSEELRKRCRYLDFELDSVALMTRCKARNLGEAAPPPGLLTASRTGVELDDDPVVVIRSLNSRFRVKQEDPAGSDKQQTSAGKQGQSLIQRPQSVRRGCRSIRTDRRFQIFGPGPEADLNQHSFSSSLNSILWKTNDVLLMVAEDFYRSERLSRLQLLPASLDQWADSMQQRLLGYQEEAWRFLSTSRDEVVQQLSVFDELLHSFPAVLISNLEKQHGAELREEVGGVRKKLEETLSASEKEKGQTVRRLRASLEDDELRVLNNGEEIRQQQLLTAIFGSHLELQECVRVREAEFVTSLASLTEKLLHQLEELNTPAETDVTQQHSEDCAITMETGAKGGSWTWSGISYLSSPTNSTADLPSTATMARTASITTAKCRLGHLSVVEHRDTAVKRFQQLVRSELKLSDHDKRRQLSEQQSWNTHWRQQIHSLKHTYVS